MTIKKYPQAKIDSHLIADSSIESSKIKQLAVTTDKIGSISGKKMTKLSEQKLADGAVTAEKTPTYIRAGMNGLSSTVWLPILRFFRWYNNSSPSPYAVISGDSAFLLKSLLGIANPGYTSKYFKGIEYARLSSSSWVDEKLYLQSYSGVYYANNMSVICLKNTSSSARTINPSVWFTAYSSSDYNKADIAALNNIGFNSDGSPVLSDLSNANNVSLLWSYVSSNEGLATAGTVTVPAGKGVVFLFRTTPRHISGSNYSYQYHNLHGFANLHHSSYWGIKCADSPNSPFEVCYELYEAVMNRNN